MRSFAFVTLGLAACGGARPSWSRPHATGAALLCGPPSSPCVKVRDEVVAQLGFTNDAPSIALDGDGRPAIAYANAVSGYHGFVARRLDDGWKSEPLPMPIASGLLVIAPDGAPELLADDGAFGVTMWRGGDAGWSKVETLGTHDGHVRATGGYDAGGRLWTAVADDDHVSIAKRDGAWTFTPIWKATVPMPVFAFGPDGRAQVAGWGTLGDVNGVLWTADGGTPEVIEKAGNAIMSQAIALGVDGDGHPHLLYLRGPGDTQSLVYATRGDAGWRTTVIATARAEGVGGCGEVLSSEAPRGDAPCHWQSDFVAPLAAIASGGDVRLLYTVSHRAGTAAARCQSSEAGPHCDWSPTTTEHTSALMIAWPDGDHLATAVAAADVELATATAAIGPDGAIHVAGYQWSDDGKPEVRYLALSASAP